HGTYLYYGMGALLARRTITCQKMMPVTPTAMAVTTACSTEFQLMPCGLELLTSFDRLLISISISVLSSLMPLSIFKNDSLFLLTSSSTIAIRSLSPPVLAVPLITSSILLIVT